MKKRGKERQNQKQEKKPFKKNNASLKTINLGK